MRIRAMPVMLGRSLRSSYESDCLTGPAQDQFQHELAAEESQ